MKYAKPPLTFEEQADLLRSRGLIGDRDLIISRLKAVNYYRLSAYSFPFRTSSTDDTFVEGTTFETVWNRYVFDRHFRLLVMDAIERIEIAVRTHLSYHHAHAFGPFGYMDNPDSLPGLNQEDLEKFKAHVADDYSKSKEEFVECYKDKYGTDQLCLPVWMATEIMTIGNILTLFRGSTRPIRKGVSAVFGVERGVFLNWLIALNAVRNICAHHGRLWNRVFGVRPTILRQEKFPEWHEPFSINNERVFAILTVCRYCVGIVAPQSGWAGRVRNLIIAYPTIPIFNMGMPANWSEHALWRPN